METIVYKMPWLTAAPESFTPHCRDLTAEQTDLGRTIQFLASHRLNGNMAAALGRAIARCRKGGANLAPLSAFRLGVLSNNTIDLIVDGFPAAGARYGINLELVVAPYDQATQQALNPHSMINTAKLDAVLLALDFRWLQIEEFIPGAAEQRITNIMHRYNELIAGLRDHAGCPAILQTVALPPHSLFGNYDRRVQDTARSIIDQVNHRLVELAQESGSYLFDVAALAERVGTDQWFDPVKWHAFKLPFASICNELYADSLGRILGAARGKSRKCLVLDLDNTLWGGVIGDDGLAGIKLGQGDSLGEAFLAVQQMVLSLRQRGIMLAVCSKNNHETALLPFTEHPEMLLKKEHISVFQANWVDKASNLEAIAKELNIGIDALVLLDDNPAERAHVRAALPMVGVPELPSDPSWYPWILSAAGYFESVAFSEEDLARAASYAADMKRAKVFSQTRDLGDYLSSLQMVINFTGFDESNRQRISQLINKSNQFNLTTRRYTETEVATMQADADIYTLQVRLADSFGKLGMIAVVVCRPDEEGKVWNIDTWLMSCRVLGRRVEEAMLAEIVHNARAHGVKMLQGSYLPTDKNIMVSEHFDKLGFTCIARYDNGSKMYELSVNNFETPALPFAIERS